MKWYAPAGETEGEACQIIGEEASDNGRWWLLCKDKPEDPTMECKLNDVLGSTDEWLCKSPKVRKRDVLRKWIGPDH